jgi:hypothetical protein
MDGYPLHFFLIENVIEESQSHAVIQMDMSQENIQRVSLDEISGTEYPGACIKNDSQLRKHQTRSLPLVVRVVSRRAKEV